MRRYLAAPPQQAALEAAAAEARAAGTGPAPLANPTLQGRHEYAPGADTVTDVVGVGLDLDLGLGALSQRAAARHAREREQATRRAALLQAVCTFRRDVLHGWAAVRRAEATDRAQDRIGTLAEELGRLAEAGEASEYEWHRAMLTASTHAAARDAARADAEARLAALAVAAGPVDDITLDPWPALPPREGLRDTLHDHPRLQAARADVETARGLRAAARRAILPDLSLSAGRRLDATGGNAPEPGFEIGGGLEIPLWDWSRGETRRGAARLAHAEAALHRTHRDLQAEVDAQHARSLRLAEAPAGAVEPDAVWDAALALYRGGETSLDALLVTAADVEAAEVARVERARRHHGARLDLACAVGSFPRPALQAALEEALP